MTDDLSRPGPDAQAIYRTGGPNSRQGLGAYGDDHMDRPELVSIARRRVYERIGVQFTPATTVLVGDNANDIRAAQEGGARIVAVATGDTDAATLRSLGADTVLDDLSDTEAVLDALLG
ncbi:hypothetical protein GCM10009799_50560 [Nocardiopsis rhodophaea]|uniref:Uncharacterized protein n=1 Tax=Nocardiopsis rhodophaea TaxID=280238 RepID=A0ABN2TPW0_9ACTN